jgi:hypothetical protein
MIIIEYHSFGLGSYVKVNDCIKTIIATRIYKQGLIYSESKAESSSAFLCSANVVTDIFETTSGVRSS